MAQEEMAKEYIPGDVEKKWYPEWEKRGYFHGDPDSEKPPYSIVIPPPNVTGVLTMGHVLNNTLQDILIRWKKMQGYEACWIPGTDHAGIATQSKVEKYLLENENVTRHNLGRENFLEKVWEWKDKHGGAIIEQLRSLGTACDWERERFTLDEGLSNAVREVFIRLYNDGLIYRGYRIIHWCPVSRTALSEEEVFYKEEQGYLWYFNYPLKDGDGVLTVATTRPETMLGDTAVAVHPEDERYSRFIGKTVELPIVNREIPVIADENVAREFGTGAVKVTPAHDPNDYEIGAAHGLATINIMNDDATMNENAGAEFEGMDRFQCREAVVERMNELGFLKRTEDYTHQVGYSERGEVPVEPRLSRQWFVKIKPLAEPALEAVTSGRIRFHPEQWVKTYKHWMENIKDWCISRQLWWGHRIPAFYCRSCGHMMVAHSCPEACEKCDTSTFDQDEDVLDTWFSSWLWPFSTLGWPEETRELQKFYPTDSLVTAPDIIFFWVARMIMSGLRFMGEEPFHDVYFTSLIRDDSGRKLSKSLNNSPDPLDVIQEYGADALRFTVIYLAPIGQDVRYSNEKCKIGRNFANKMWNAARFRQRQGGCSEGAFDLSDLTAEDLRADDQWILGRTNETIKRVNNALENFHFHEVSHTLYDFVWSEFCDWYLESTKAVLNHSDNENLRNTVLRVFDFCFSHILRLLHPVMPFVTEELYHALGLTSSDDSIMLASWSTPLSEQECENMGITSEVMEFVREKFELISAVRNVKASYRIPDKQKVQVIVAPKHNGHAENLKDDWASLYALLAASDIQIDSAYKPDGPTGSAVTDLGTAYLPLEGVIDIDAEKERLEKQEKELTDAIERSQKKLSNRGFISKAPEEVVEQEKRRLSELKEKLNRLQEQLGTLK